MSNPINQEIHWRDLTTLSAAIQSREISPTELVAHFTQRINAFDPTLNAFRLLCLDSAAQQAQVLEDELAKGINRGPLHGLPYAAKDLFDVKGLPTSAGCPLLEDTCAAQHSTVIARLEAAGMILLGKTNTVQFAYGGAGVNSQHGTPHNPWHQTHHLPGGSSSGSAVAVAAGLTPMALGTDTGGSVRIPAALCGLSGLKTTVGRISRAGVYPLSWSLDSVGPLCRSVRDNALIFDALNGDDPGDASTHGHERQTTSGQLDSKISSLRFALAEGALWDQVDDEVASIVRDSAQHLASLGARIDSLQFPQAQQALELNPRGLVIAAEAYTLNRHLIDEHFSELDPIVAERMIKGRDVSGDEYLQGIHAWNGLRAETMAALCDVDILICPTAMDAATPLSNVVDDITAYGEQNLRYLRNTAVGNILNLCGLSIPCGITSKGLPVGMMLYAKPFDELTLLRAGQAVQDLTDWHQRNPDLNWLNAE
jgi:aspartyl-tRNA(Asn)/glutamyl-tRNA(Gln) amidotransferase subunit A